MASAAVAAAMATAEAAGSAAGCGTRHSHRSSDCKMSAPGPNLGTRSSPAQAPYLCTAHHSSTPCRCPVHMGSSSSSMTPHRQAQAGHRPRSHPVWTTCIRSHTRCPTHHHAGSRRVQHLVTDRQPGGCHLPCAAHVAEGHSLAELQVAQAAVVVHLAVEAVEMAHQWLTMCGRAHVCCIQTQRTCYPALSDSRWSRSSWHIRNEWPCTMRSHVHKRRGSYPSGMSMPWLWLRLWKGPPPNHGATDGTLTGNQRTYSLPQCRRLWHMCSCRS